LRRNGIPLHVQTWVNQDTMKEIITSIPQQILNEIKNVLKEKEITKSNITKK
jgi:hypothetical protein